MAEEKKEKSNFILVFAAFSIGAIILVLVLKGRETEHLSAQPGAGTTLEGNASALHEAKRFNNDNSGSLE